LISISCTHARRETGGPAAKIVVTENAIDLNSATAKQLEEIPGIGKTLSQRIVEFREKNGKFRRPEHLLLVPGISEKRFREIRTLIRTD
jgi:competence protein ComEA